MKPSDIKTEGLEARFWSKVDTSDKDGCWTWGAARDKEGYGQFCIEHSMKLAHRTAYLLTHGEIPDGLCVCHTCDNPGCVRPSHLWVGTQRDNLRDAANKGRMGNSGEAHPNAKLTRAQVDEIRARYKPRVVTTYSLAREYGVGQAIICKIINYQHWI